MGAPTPDETRTVTEYRVMWWSEEFEKWFPHAPPTDDPAIAQAWLRQAKYRGDRRGPVSVALDSRDVTPWRARSVIHPETPPDA